VPRAVAESLKILTRNVDGRRLTTGTLTEAMRNTDLQLRHRIP
jgi:hypothetical protein